LAGKYQKKQIERYLKGRIIKDEEKERARAEGRAF
jgi:hypothetical protein